MRQIKFEYGFESVNGTVKKVYHLSDIPNIQQKCDVWNVLPIKYVRQFTGLKDRNGVEIYEGDIVKTDLCHPSWVDCLYKVVFQDGAFQMKTGNRKGSLAFAYHIHTAIINDAIEKESDYEKHLEVIGNIYEHPNLLTNE